MSNASAAIEPGLPDRDVRLSLFESAVNGTRNGIVITTPDGSILYVNPAFTEITGYSRDHVIGKNMRILQSGRQSQSFYEAMWVSLRSQDSWSGSVWNRRSDGEIYQEWLSINAIRNERQETTAYVGMFSDISSIRSREHQLERMAYIDPLTELPNRLLFRDRLSQTIAFARKSGHGMALLVADLDSQVRRILEFLELPFEESCLNYYQTDRSIRTPSSEQVRQPIYQSGLEHWRHFEEHLDPLKKALGPVLERYSID